MIGQSTDKGGEWLPKAGREKQGVTADGCGVSF